MVGDGDAEQPLLVPADTPGGSSADAPEADGAAPVICPACGSRVLPGERFCEACGSALTGVRAPGPPPPPPARSAPGDIARASSVTVPLSRCASCGELSAMTDGYCSICGMRAPTARDHVEASGPGWAGVSDRGQHHARNEDAFRASASNGVGASPADPAADGSGHARRVVVAVSDGVSTTQRPDEASLACVEAVHHALVEASHDLVAAGAAGREAVLAVAPTGERDLGPPSCTVLMAVVDDEAMDLGWLGDCRAYWLDADGVEVLTTDHSWAAEEVAAGTRSEAEALEDPRAHMITRWVGADADPAWQPTTRRFHPPGPGHLVLCSDGLWNYFSEPATLPEVTGELDDLLAASNRLVDFANAAGGHDNITVVVVAWPPVDAAPPAAPVVTVAADSPGAPDDLPPIALPASEDPA